VWRKKREVQKEISTVKHDLTCPILKTQRRRGRESESEEEEEEKGKGLVLLMNRECFETSTTRM